MQDVEESESVRIYHHSIHQKNLKKSAILKLETSTGLLEGHSKCAEFLEGLVADILLNPAVRDHHAEQLLLEEISPVFTTADNNLMLATPTKQEVKETIMDSNLHAAPGNDVIHSVQDMLGHHGCSPDRGHAGDPPM